MDRDLDTIHHYFRRVSGDLYDPSELHDAFDGLHERLAALAERLHVLEAARNSTWRVALCSVPCPWRSTPRPSTLRIGRRWTH